MSRQIDLGKPLSDEDREYLVSRSRLDDIRENDERFAGDEESTGGQVNDGHTGDVDPFKADGAGEDQLTGMSPGEKPLTEVQGREVDRETPEHQGGDGDEDAEDTRNYEEDYDQWSKSNLQKEIDERNADPERGDDEKIARTGTVAELAKRLEDDDS